MTLMLAYGQGLTQLKGSPQWSTYSDGHWDPSRLRQPPTHLTTTARDLALTCQP